MGQLGLGVLLRRLFGSTASSVAAFQSAVGKTIQSLAIDDDANGGDGALRFTFTDGTTLLLMDRGRSCCETRYLQTDDDLSTHIGSALVTAEVTDGPPIEDGGEEHETAFLHVTTSAGTFTVVTHNEHNGYYGGFAIEAALGEEA